MKIISKYKDYYDFLKGIYGEDPKLVLDRTKFESLPYPPSNYDILNFFVGEWQVQCLYFDGKYYWGKDLIENFKPAPKEYQLSGKYQKWYRDIADINKASNYYSLEIPSRRFSQKNTERISVLKNPVFIGDKSPTWKEDCPILLSKYTTYLDGFLRFPKLDDFAFSKIMEPHDIWIKLTEWLSKRVTMNEPEVPVGDDKTRLISAGFDPKTSFRH